MIRRSVDLRGFWPWLLIVLVLVTGLVIASCSSGAAVATPTPTKTPRPAGSLATATPPPTEIARAETPTNAPTATNPPAAAKAPAATDAPKPTAAPTSGAVAATNTPQPRQATPAVGSNTKMGSPDYGIQSFLWWRPEVADRDLNLVKDAGFGWVKQYFAWQDIEGAKKGSFDWERADRIVDEANKRGLKLLVRIGMDPDRAFLGGRSAGQHRPLLRFRGAGRQPLQRSDPGLSGLERAQSGARMGQEAPGSGGICAHVTHDLQFHQIERPQCHRRDSGYGSHHRRQRPSHARP